MFCWALRQVDFVLAYPQAPIEEDIYMEVPQGINTATGNSKDMVLKLLKNIYRQKQAGCVWNSYLVEKLASIGFRPSLIDDCVFFRDEVIFFALYLASTANYLRTTLAHWNSPNFQSYVLGQSISTYVIIIFAKTCVRDLSRSFPLAQKTRSLTHLPRHWHKMTSHVIANFYVASNTSKPPIWGSVTLLGIHRYSKYLFIQFLHYFTGPYFHVIIIWGISTIIFVLKETPRKLSLEICKPVWLLDANHFRN